MKKVIFVILSFGLFLLLSPSVLAKTSFHLVFPIRGHDFWQRPWQPEEKTQEFITFLSKNHLSATFLLRFDALENSIITNLLRDNPSINKGIFLEITPSLTQKINLSYPKNDTRWYYPDRVFTVSYSIPQRRKIIDAYLNKFQDNFHQLPTLVGAWYLDPFSIRYLKEKYSITSFLIVSDQDGTDHYLVWGLPFSRNYRASLLNPLIPGKENVNIYQWAPRDIFYGLGLASQRANLYSLQTNDYLKLNLTLNYWLSVVNDYQTSSLSDPFTLILGLENDEPNSEAYRDFFNGVTKLKKQGFIITKNLTASPISFFDILRSERANQTAYLIQNQNYRVYIKTNSKESRILDLRSFTGNDYPVFWSFYPNKNKLLYAQTDAVIDNVQLRNSINLPYTLTLDKQTKSLKSKGKIKITFTGNQIEFTSLPNNLAQAVSGFSDIRVRKNKLIFSNFYQNQLRVNFMAIVWLLFFIFIGYSLLKYFLGTVQSLFLIFLSLLWSFPLLKSGLPTKYGLGFWGPNGHDAIWHLALTQSILQRFPIEHPTLAGHLLVNYHFGFDLLLAILYKLTHFPLTFLYFQFIPPFFALTILVLSYKLYLKLFNTSKGSYLSLFFLVTSGSLGFIISLIKHQPVGGESAFWANQAISTLLNPPFASSLILILITMLMLVKKKKTTLDYIWIYTLPAVTLWFKVYGGLFLFTLVSLWTLITLRERDCISRSRSVIGIGFILFIISLKALTGSKSLIVFQPFWFITNMFIFPDRVGWTKFGRALITYLQSYNPKLIIALPLALFIFYLGNFGTRVLSLFSLKYLKPYNKNLLFSLWVTIIIFSFIPLFIIQKGTPWNSIQFLYYPLFFTAFLSGTLAIFNFPTFRFKNFKLKIKNLVIMIIILLTIPTTVATLSYYLPQVPHATLPWEEVKALEFLSKQPAGSIITPPFNPYLKNTYNNPTPLFAYVDTAYVTAFSGKPDYLADTMNLDISGYNYQHRQLILKKLYNPQVSGKVKTYLLRQIVKEVPTLKYIYLLHLPDYELNPPSPWHKIYQNSLVEVWKKCK